MGSSNYVSWVAMVKIKTRMRKYINDDYVTLKTMNDVGMTNQMTAAQLNALQPKFDAAIKVLFDKAIDEWSQFIKFRFFTKKWARAAKMFKVPVQTVI